MGQLVRVKKLDPDFVCTRCQGTTADEWVVTYCPSCGDRRQEAVLRACPKCKYDFRKGVQMPEMWHPAPPPALPPAAPVQLPWPSAGPVPAQLVAAAPVPTAGQVPTTLTATAGLGRARWVPAQAHPRQRPCPRRDGTPTFGNGTRNVGGTGQIGPKRCAPGESRRWTRSRSPLQPRAHDGQGLPPFAGRCRTYDRPSRRRQRGRTFLEAE